MRHFSRRLPYQFFHFRKCARTVSSSPCKRPSAVAYLHRVCSLANETQIKNKDGAHCADEIVALAITTLHFQQVFHQLVFGHGAASAEQDRRIRRGVKGWRTPTEINTACGVYRARTSGP